MKLSPRMQQVCEMTLQGLKNERIADSLKISVNTVKKYKARLYKQLGTHSKYELRRKFSDAPVRVYGPEITRLQTFQAYRAQGLTYKEIGRLEGVTPDHVKTYIYRYGA